MSSLREKILNEVGPTNTQLADRSKILALGDQAVPILIDLFLNPTTQYGIINQATLADALIEFSKQTNNEAHVFIRRIAVGDVPPAGAYGGAAREIVQQHFEWIGVDPSAAATKPAMLNETPAAPLPAESKKARAAAVMRILIAVARADHVIDKREKEVLRGFVSQLGITRDEFEALAAEKAVVNTADLPSDREERLNLLTDAFSLALADGTIAPEEQSVMERLAKGLGIGAHDLDFCLQAAREKTGTTGTREYAVPEGWSVHDVVSFPEDSHRLDQLKSQLASIYQKNQGRVVFDLTHLPSVGDPNYDRPMGELSADETARGYIWDEITLLPRTIQRSAGGRDESWPRPCIAVVRNSHIHRTMTDTRMDMFCDLIVAPSCKPKQTMRPAATPSDDWSRLLAENRRYISGDLADDEVNKVLLNCHYPDCATADRLLGQVSGEIAGKLRPVNEGFSSDSGSRRYHVAHEGRLSGREVKEYLLTVCKPGAGAIYEVLL